MRGFGFVTALVVLASTPAWGQGSAPRTPAPVPAPLPSKDIAKPAAATGRDQGTASKQVAKPGGTRAATKANVMEALQAAGPITQQRVASMGDDADLVLIDLVRDSKLDRQVRGRAIDALAFSGTPVARDQLVRMATVSSTAELEEPLVRRTLLGLGWMRDGRANDVISPWLSHERAGIRLDAAVALALLKTPAALESLERHARAEKDPSVRAQVERLVRQLRMELPQPPKRRQEQPRVQPPGPVEGRDSTRF